MFRYKKKTSRRIINKHLPHEIGLQVYSVISIDSWSSMEIYDRVVHDSIFVR